MYRLGYYAFLPDAAIDAREARLIPVRHQELRDISREEYPEMCG